MALLAAIAMMGTWLLFVYAVMAAQQRQCRLFDGDGEQICESAEAATQVAELELETGSEPESEQKRRRQECGSSYGNATAGSAATHVSEEDTKTLRAFDQNSNFEYTVPCARTECLTSHVCPSHRGRGISMAWVMLAAEDPG